MARKALVLKALKKPKFSTRKQTRCGVCGRPKGYLRRFNMCRICFREYASKGEIPGVRKSSW
jgi:small subunit ribosomal protein S14